MWQLLDILVFGSKLSSASKVTLKETLIVVALVIKDPVLRNRPVHLKHWNIALLVLAVVIRMFLRASCCLEHFHFGTVQIRHESGA